MNKRKFGRLWLYAKCSSPFGCRQAQQPNKVARILSAADPVRESARSTTGSAADAERKVTACGRRR
jgi:hypothetical protein